MFGSDDGVRVWLNGEFVAERAIARSLTVEDHVLTLPLRAGANHLFVKVVNEGGAWQFELQPWKRIEQKLIDRAIDRGVAYLREQQLLDGSWGDHEEFGAGHTAFTAYTQAAYRAALFEAKPIGRLTNPEETNQLRPNHTLRAVRPGRARGRLVGGNLSLVAATMGTPYEIDTRGRILFIEDIEEQPYSIDRMLTQLRLAGKFDQAAGIVWGECNDCSPRTYQPSFVEGTFTTAEVVDRILGGLKIPVLSGLTIGHTSDQLTLPLGVLAELDADKGTLTIEEAATTA